MCTRVLIAVVMIMLVFSVNVMAMPVININFDSDPIGATPAFVETPVAGAPITQLARVTQFTTALPATTVKVEASLTDVGTGVTLGGAGNNVLVLTDQSTVSWKGVGFAVRLNPADSVSTGKVKVDFDFLSLSNLANGSNALTQFNMFFGFASNASGEPGLDSYYYGGDNGTRSATWNADNAVLGAAPLGNLSPRVIEGQKHHFTFELNMDTRTSSVTVDGIAMATNKAFNGTAAATASFGYFSFAPSGSSAGIFGVDNIVITPEPATMALLGLGALVFARKRKA